MGDIQIAKRRPDPVHFLLRQAEPESTTETPFISIYPNRGGPLIIAQNNLSTVLQDSFHKASSTSTVAEIESGAKKDGFELHYPPDTPFYPTPKPWLPVLSKMNSVPLFYLTNSLSRAQHKTLESTIQEPADADLPGVPKVCCFVPWLDPNDGDESSMWDVFWEMRSHRNTINHIPYPYLFIDRQSVVDGTLIVMTPNWWCNICRGIEEYEAEKGKAERVLAGVAVEPTLQGLKYGRIAGRDAHVVYANLSISNMGFEDFFRGFEDEIVKVPREGWPGHGVLKDKDD